jgi:hypothetical protein
MNTNNTSRLIKRAEKLSDGEKYQEAIDLLLDKPSKKDKQNPDYWLLLSSGLLSLNDHLFEGLNTDQLIDYFTRAITIYEEDINRFKNFTKQIDWAKDSLVTCFAYNGLNGIEQRNKKLIETNKKLIIDHMHFCNNLQGYYIMGDFFLNYSIMVSFDQTSIMHSIKAFEKGLTMPGNKPDEQNDVVLNLNTAYAELVYYLLNEQKNYERAIKYIKKIMKSKLDFSNINNYDYLFKISSSLFLYQSNYEIYGISENIYPTASKYLNEVLNCNEDIIKNLALLQLASINIDNPENALNYLAQITSTDKELVDIVSFLKSIALIKKDPSEAILGLSSVQETGFLPDGFVKTLQCIAYFNNSNEEKAIQILNDLNRDKLPEVILPIYDFLHFCIFKNDNSLNDLNHWRDKYPNSKVFNNFLDAAEELANCEDDDTNEIVKQILENQQIFIPHLMEIASSLPGKKGNSKPHVTEFDGLIIVLKNTLGNDRIKFCLTRENEKSDPIQITNTAMSFLLFLCYERSNEQENWLDNPKIGKRMEIYADILSKLKVDDRYVDEMDGKVENFNGWIWDFENKYRKKIVSEIKDEFSRIINGKLILCHPYKSNKKGRYYLNPTIQKITIN